MKSVARGSTLARLLLAATLAVSPVLLAEEDDTSTEDPGVEQATEQSLLDAIRRRESRDGAYSADLP